MARGMGSTGGLFVPDRTRLERGLMLSRYKHQDDPGVAAGIYGENAKTVCAELGNSLPPPFGVGQLTLM